MKNTSGERLSDVGISDNETTYPSGWKTRWFKGRKNVTTDVHTDAGYVFALRRDRSKIFRQRLKAPEAAGPFCVTMAAGWDGGLGIATAGVNGAVCGL